MMMISRAGAIYQRLLVSSTLEANYNQNMQPSRNLFTRYFISQKPRTPYNWRSQRTATSKAGKEQFRQASTLKLALLGTTIGAGSGTAYTLYNSWKDKHSHMEHERVPPARLKHFPDNVRITKRYYNSDDKSGLDIVLFQFQTCPFCCKVRAYLDYMGISYSVVEVDAVLRQDIKWSETKKVPMILIREKKTNLSLQSNPELKEIQNDYIQMYDSSAIISLLATYLNENLQKKNKKDLIELAQYYPTISYFDDDNKKKYDILNKYFLMFGERGAPKNLSKDKEEDERKWRTWCDQLLVHLISPNCYQTLPEALETFEWFSEAGEWDIHFPRWERNLMVYAGAGAMWGIAKILKRRHQLTEDVRSYIYEALDNWSKELQEKNTRFHGGKQPNLADLSVFGVLSSMEGCQAFKDIIDNTEIGNWFYDVKQIVAQNRGQLIRERIAGENALALLENSTA